MEKLIIKKSNALQGSIVISGSKNAALPIMAASLLSKKQCSFYNIPNLADVSTMVTLLSNLGVVCKKVSNGVILNANKLNNFRADYDLVRKMRASILVLGPLISRKGKAVISLPGGCAIGNRPIDLHLFGLKKMGAKINIKDGYIFAEAKDKLKGSHIILPSISVGATENIILAASLAKGKTIIENAAVEPEIEDLCLCLNSMGAKITGIGKNKIIIQGVNELKDVVYSIIPDRIVAGTFLISALITQGSLTLKKVNPKHLKCPISILKKIGAKIKINIDSIYIDAKNGKLKPIDIVTEPYPGFPTDLQAQFMSLLSLVKGNSTIQEKIFENRFMHVSELNRLGASIIVKKDKAMIKGVHNLIGAPVMASDLRASVSLLLAGMAAEGETTINRIYHLDRGYERIENSLNRRGANIKRVK